MRPALPLFLTAALAACASTTAPDLPDPLGVRERFAVRYSGALGTDARTPMLSVVDFDERGEVDPDRPQAAVETRIVRMPGVQAHRVLGIDDPLAASPDGTSFGGGRIDREEMQRVVDGLLSAGVATEIESPNFLVAEGLWARAGSVRRIAMVDGYCIAADGAKFIADPVVDEGEVGVALGCLVTEIDEDGGMVVECRVRVVDLLGDLRRLIADFNGASEVAVQVPLVCRQQIEGGAALGAGEALYLAGLHVPGSNDVIVVFVDPRVADLGQPDGD